MDTTWGLTPRYIEVANLPLIPMMMTLVPWALALGMVLLVLWRVCPIMLIVFDVSYPHFGHEQTPQSDILIPVKNGSEANILRADCGCSYIWPCFMLPHLPWYFSLYFQPEASTKRAHVLLVRPVVGILLVDVLSPLGWAPGTAAHPPGCFSAAARKLPNGVCVEGVEP